MPSIVNGMDPIQLAQIADAIGTPFYAYSRELLIDAWHRFDRAFSQHAHLICFAVKANSNLAVLRLFAELGAGFDVVSKGELAKVLHADGSPQKIVFSGVGKTADDIAYALENNIFCFNVESRSELHLIHQIAQHLNTRASIAIRINPDIAPNSHPYISTGTKENKFGIPLSETLSVYQTAADLPHLHIRGAACHIGSQLVELAPFEQSFDALLSLAAMLKAHHIPLQHLDFGGGLGIKYQHETPPTVECYAKALLDRKPDPALTLVFEPGRFLTANAGVLVTRVLSLKETACKRFCIVDAGMNDLIRPALYHAWHEIICLTPSSNTPVFLYDVVGPLCESGDFLANDRLLGVAPGDLLAICQAGAYGFVNSSNYNSRPRSAEVMVSRNAYKVVRQRETLEMLWALETIW